MEVIVNPIVHIYQLLTIGVCMTAIAFIAFVMWLDNTPRPTPIELPAKPPLHAIKKLKKIVQ